jgi:hypothetical protein
MNSTIRPRIVLTLPVLLAVACGVCLAQADPAAPVEVSVQKPATEKPPPPKPKTEPVNEDLTVVPILEADPDNPNQPRKSEPEVKKPVLVREGKRFFDRDGHITRKGNETVFVFVSGAEPMVLSPCRSLERTENLSQFGKRPLSFTVSGVVSEYRDRNYLLMTDSPRMTESPVEKDAADGKTDPAKVTKKSGASGGRDSAATQSPPATRDRSAPPEAGDVDIPDVPGVPSRASTRPRTPAGDRRSSRRSSSPGLLPEDKRLVDREGRVIREGADTVFVFDNGDTPIVLLPNRKLQRIEVLSDYGRKPMRFRISGRVTEYRGRNYLLASKVVIIPKAVEKL